MYVRQSVLCKTGRPNGWIVKIKPVMYSIQEYNVSLQDPVNTVAFAGNCDVPRSLQFRELEELYDVDVIVEVSDLHTTTANANASLTTTAWIGIGVSGFAILAIAALLIVRAKSSRRLTQVTKINRVNPLNQVPVVIPWTNKQDPWRLSDTLPLVRTEFSPMRVNKSLLL